MLEHIKLTDIRNIANADLLPANNINLLIGDNGSGKTSIIEAIYLLAMGRSFRTRSLKNVVRADTTALTVFAKTIKNKTPIGLHFDSSTRLVSIRLNNAPLTKLSDLATYLPLQYIPANCHEFFELGPKFRRKLVDWGVFHVEHDFNYHWQAYKKSLQQRNSSIRNKQTKSLIEAWNSQLVEHGEKLTIYREQYLNELVTLFNRVFPEICLVDKGLLAKPFTLKYQRGWSKDISLSDFFKENFDRDIQLGYTRSGPHVADWSFRVNDSDPAEFFSRGQQKLFYFAICISQILLLNKRGQLDQSILLIDDISSELDREHINTLIEKLRSLPVQAYISSTDTSLKDQMKADDKVFHVERGLVEALV